MREKEPKQLFLLGSVRIKAGETTVDQFRSHRAVALLVYLVSHAQPIPRSELMELIWPDMPQERQQANLRWALSYCKKLLPDCWHITRQTAQFQPDAACYVDVHSLAVALADENVVELETTVAYVHGDFCRGLFFDESPEFETWLLTQREYWRQQLAVAWQRLIDHYRRQGDYARALAFARRLLALDTWQESAHQQVMALLAHSGDFNGALAQYETCRHLLADHLGVEPMPATTALYRRIQAARTRPRHNLPDQPTPFIGRETELTAVTDLLARHRLITIMAPGGMGKTRLALAAAAQNTAVFLEGVAFVPLASLDAPALLATTIVESLSAAGFIAPRQGHISARDHLLAELVDREMLLVLDNYDHLLPEVTLLTAVLQAAPQVKLLVTSRERLALRWERPFALHGLPYPEDAADSTWQAYAAPRLFLQFTATVNPAYQPTEADLEAIIRICKLVEGMPLALELAATWMRVQPPAVIAAEIAHNLAALHTRQRDLPARQRSMHAVFDQTWARLAADEQATLAQLAVFRGPFGYEAAQAVAAANWSLLAALSDRALLRQRQVSTDTDTTVVFEIHELLRQYAAEQLADMVADAGADAAQRRHCHYYAARLANWEHQLQDGRTETAVLIHMQQEIDNIRAAWEWALAHHDAASLNQMIEGIYQFYALPALVRDGQMVMAEAAARLAGVSGEAVRLVYGRVLARLGAFTWLLHEDYAAAEVQLRASLEILMPPADGLEVARVLHTLGNVTYANDLAAGHDYWRRSLAIYKEIGNAEREATILRNLCVTAPTYADMLGYWEQALALAEASHDRRNAGHLYFIRGDKEHQAGHWQMGQALTEKSIEMLRTVDDPPHLILALNVQADIYTGQQQIEQAESLLAEMQAIAGRIGIRWHLLLVRLAAASLATAQGALTEAEMQLTAVLAAAGEDGGYSTLRQIGLLHLGRCNFLQGKWAQARKAWAQCRDESAAGDFNTRSRRWRALVGMGETWASEGVWETAVACWQEARQIAQALGAEAAWQQVQSRLPEP